VRILFADAGAHGLREEPALEKAELLVVARRGDRIDRSVRSTMNAFLDAAWAVLEAQHGVAACCAESKKRVGGAFCSTCGHYIAHHRARTRDDLVDFLRALNTTRTNLPHAVKHGFASRGWFFLDGLPARGTVVEVWNVENLILGGGLAPAYRRRRLNGGTRQRDLSSTWNPPEAT
jgi:hypothetical protein